MAKFRFSLEQVLDYRRQMEDQARMDMAKAQAAFNEAQGKLDGFTAKLAHHEASLYASDPVAEAELWLWRRYHTALKEDIAHAQKQVHKLSGILAKTRQRLVERSRDKKLLERLRANQEIAFRKEENLKEQRESDEMATVRFRHQTV